MLCLSVFVMLLSLNASTAYVTGTMAILAVTAWKTLPEIIKILNSITEVRSSLPYISSQIDYFKTIEADSRLNHENKIQPENPKKPTDHCNASVFKSKIQFSNVSYTYQENGKNVLHDLCFEIKKGETIGIIECIQDLKIIFQAFDLLPEAVQLVLVDMRFNLGPGRFRHFRKMIAAVEDQNFSRAAAEMKDSRWYTRWAKEPEPL